MTYSEELVPFLQAWEGLKLVPSEDPLVPGVFDVGHGHRLLPGEDVRPITPAEALELLRWDLNIVDDEVDELVIPELDQNMADGVISWTFNLGRGALARSTLLKRLNVGDFDGAANEFGKWIFAGGHEAPGLVKRRAAERAIFVEGRYDVRP